MALDTKQKRMAAMNPASPWRGPMVDAPETGTTQGNRQAMLFLCAGILALAAIIIDDSFEGSSVNVAASSVSGVGDSAVVSLKPRVQTSEAAAGARHLGVIARLTGVNGIRPTIKVLDITSGVFHGYPWQSGRRMYFSLDAGATWTVFDTNPTVNAGDITIRHSTAFTGNVAIVAHERMWTPTMHAAWIAGLASTYPSLIASVPSNVSDFESGTFSTQTDDLGRTVPAQKFHGFKIHDASLPPTVGSAKRAFAFTMGTHSREATGSRVCKAAIEFLLSADAQAQNVRANADVYVHGLISAPGSAGGHWRGTFEEGALGEDDANRHFSDTVAPIQSVSIPRTAMLLDLPVVVQASIDFHSDYGFYGGQLITYTDNAVGNAYYTALDIYVGTITDAGDAGTGFVSTWFENAKGTQLAVTSEIAETSPLDDAAIAAWAEAHIKALSDLITSADIPAAPSVGARRIGGPKLQRMRLVG